MPDRRSWALRAICLECTVRYWDGKAEEALALAGGFGDQASQEAMEQVAEIYQRLADLARERLAFQLPPEKT